jgi:hypothetical protein
VYNLVRVFLVLISIVFTGATVDTSEIYHSSPDLCTWINAASRPHGPGQIEQPHEDEVWTNQIMLHHKLSSFCTQSLLSMNPTLDSSGIAQHMHAGVDDSLAAKTPR